MNYIGNASSYLTNLIFGIALYLMLLRYWMQWVHADFRNPIGRFIISLTNPVVIPMRRILPSFRSVDTATLLLAYALAVLSILILVSLSGQNYSWISLLSFSLGKVIDASINIFMLAILVQILASWLNPHAYHPALDIARAIAEPLLAPARRLIPAIGGLDISPILVFVFLNLSKILVVAPLQNV